ncbi:hypothetical protein BCEN4_1580031 [Burkholderia cenocepacia]|nr:hypothetical protein BCEN4_1580031 [Burkholderia cenocepacia]
MVRKRRPVSPRQQLEAIVEKSVNTSNAQRTDTPDRHFDRQWITVEPTADIANETSAFS